ncbi:MAG: hypothetical protein R2867_46050 [Caldilineaceae bacterium]
MADWQVEYHSRSAELPTTGPTGHVVNGQLSYRFQRDSTVDDATLDVNDAGANGVHPKMNSHWGPPALRRRSTSRLHSTYQPGR